MIACTVILFVLFMVVKRLDWRLRWTGHVDVEAPPPKAGAALAGAAAAPVAPPAPALHVHASSPRCSEAMP